MIRNVVTSTLFPVVAFAAMAGVSAEATAADREKQFFQSVEGKWSGPGEIVAGKYKGTKFICNFTGAVPNGQTGMSLDGGCRVGVFTQKMSANISRVGKKGYRGTFMDGAAGKGLDVVGGTVTGDRVVFALNRKALNGAMQARLPDENTMKVTVSVKVEDQMIPVIGMNLKRLDNNSVGSIAQE